jgi:hypothetical protein
LIIERADSNCGGSGRGSGQLFVDALDDVQRGGGAGLEDGHQRGALAIDADDVGLGRKAVANMSHVADVDHGAIHRFDGQVVQLVDHRGRGVGFDRVLERRRPSWCPAGTIRFCARWRLRHRSVKALRLHRVKIEIDLDLTLLAAVGVGERRAFDGGEPGADEVGSEIVELLFGKPLAGEAELEHRNAGGVVLDDEWRSCSGGQTAQQHLADSR